MINSVNEFKGALSKSLALFQEANDLKSNNDLIEHYVVTTGAYQELRKTGDG